MPKIALIPGHGGFDSGVYNPVTNIKESDANLSVALMLRDILLYNGFEVAMSRLIDVACGMAVNTKDDVNNQIKFANNSGADIAIAIHFNGHVNKTANGIEVLYTNYPKQDDNELRLASILLDELIKETKLTNRSIKEISSGIGVIKNVKIPCVLSENGFISNDKESIWAYSKEHNYRIAVAHAKAICRYFDIKFNDPMGDSKEVVNIKANIKLPDVDVSLNNIDVKNSVILNVDGKDTTYIPAVILRDIGFNVRWDEVTKSVVINN